MDFEQLFQNIAYVAENYGALIAIVLSWVIILIVRAVRHRDWRKKRFLRHVTFSLNLISWGGDARKSLLLRTLRESKIEDVFNNENAEKLVMERAQATEAKDPFMSFEDEDDLEWVKKAVLNHLSQDFADIFVAKALKLPTSSQEFVYGVTCEKYGDLPSQKIRVMLISRDDLERYFLPKSGIAQGKQWAESVSISHPAHELRIRTLQYMGHLWERHDPRLGVIELGVVS